MLGYPNEVPVSGMSKYYMKDELQHETLATYSLPVIPLFNCGKLKLFPQFRKKIDVIVLNFKPFPLKC